MGNVCASPSNGSSAQKCNVVDEHVVKIGSISSDTARVYSHGSAQPGLLPDKCNHSDGNLLRTYSYQQAMLKSDPRTVVEFTNNEHSSSPAVTVYPMVDMDLEASMVVLRGMNKDIQIQATFISEKYGHVVVDVPDLIRREISLSTKWGLEIVACVDNHKEVATELVGWLVTRYISTKVINARDSQQGCRSPKFVLIGCMSTTDQALYFADLGIVPDAIITLTPGCDTTADVSHSSTTESGISHSAAVISFDATIYTGKRIPQANATIVGCGTGKSKDTVFAEICNILDTLYTGDISDMVASSIDTVNNILSPESDGAESVVEFLNAMATADVQLSSPSDRKTSLSNEQLETDIPPAMIACAVGLRVIPVRQPVCPFLHCFVVPNSR